MSESDVRTGDERERENAAVATAERKKGKPILSLVRSAPPENLFVRAGAQRESDVVAVARPDPTPWGRIKKPNLCASILHFMLMHAFIRSRIYASSPRRKYYDVTKQTDTVLSINRPTSYVQAWQRPSISKFKTSDQQSVRWYLPVPAAEQT